MNSCKPLVRIFLVIVFLVSFNGNLYSQGSSPGVLRPHPVNSGAQFNNIYALVVGIREYQDPDMPKLLFADKDAVAFYNYLLQAFPDKLKPVENIKLLLNEKATRSSLVEALRWLRDKAGEKDLVIFYFAGHGGLDDDGLKSNNSDLPGYLAAYNAKNGNLNGGGSFPISDLDQLLNEEISKIKKATTVCILDACHAGKSVDLNNKLSGNPGSVIKMLASYGDELAKECEDLCDGYGAFTYYLIKGLLRDGDLNNDSIVDVSEIEIYLHNTVREKTNDNQHPKIIFRSDLKLSYLKNKVPPTLNCFIDGKIDVVSPVNIPISEEDFINKQLTGIQKEHYKHFKNALQQKQWIYPDNNNAFYYYQMLIEDGLSGPVLEQVKSQWKIKFQDFAQTLILDYLNESNNAPYSTYEMAAKMLDDCLLYSDKSDPGYNILRSKKIWLECYSINRKLDRKFLPVSQNEERKIKTGLISKLNEAILLDPRAAYLRNTLGAIYDNIGMRAKAEDAYRKAIQLAPKWTYPHNNLSFVIPNIDDKIAQLDTCILLNPNMYLAYVNLAIKYRVNKKDTLKCREYLDKSLAICQAREMQGDELAWIYRQYANLYQGRNMRKEAEEYLKKSKDIIGLKTPTYYIALADLYIAFGEFDKAKIELETAVKINPNDGDVYLSMGERCGGMKDYGSAIQYYKKALTLDSTDAYKYFKLASSYRLNNDDEVVDPAVAAEYALNEIDHALQLAPNEEYILAEKANICLERKDTGAALIYWNKCLSLDPQNSYIYYSMSYMFGKKNVVRAKELVNAAIAKLAPLKDAGYYSRLADLFYMEEKYVDALFYYRDAWRLNPNTISNSLYLSYTYYHLNKKDSAAAILDKAIDNELTTTGVARTNALDYLKNRVKVASENSFYYYALGYYYENEGKENRQNYNIDQAVKWYGYAVQMNNAVALLKLKGLYERRAINKSNASDIVGRYAKMIGSSGTIKKFTIPCKFPDSSRRALNVYVSEFPGNKEQVMEGEISRIKEVYNATIPYEVIDAFNKLYKIAIDNKVSYTELCVYALDVANESKKKKSEQKSHVTAARSENEEINVIYSIKSGQTKNISARMKIAIEQQTGVDISDWDQAYKMLTDKLRSDKEQHPIYYYALGYLYENNQLNKDISKARKWYGYAFQMGYYPAFFKLDSLYKYVSQSKLEWLRMNYMKDFYGITVGVDENDKKYDIYLMDFPTDPASPVGQEVDRIYDVYGVHVKKSAIDVLNELYKASEKNNSSFIEICRYAMEKSDSTSATHYYILGNNYYKEKKYNLAIECYEKSLQLNSRNTSTMNSLGIAYTYSKEYEKGLRWLFKQIEIDPRTAQLAYYNIACNFSLQSKSNNALDYLEKSFKAGNRSFEDIDKDEDFNNIRSLPEYTRLINKYKSSTK